LVFLLVVDSRPNSLRQVETDTHTGRDSCVGKDLYIFLLKVSQEMRNLTQLSRSKVFLPVADSTLMSVKLISSNCFDAKTRFEHAVLPRV